MVYAASFGDEVTNLLGTVLAATVKVIIFVAIMSVSWYVATWLHRWLTRAARRAGLDQLAERGGLHRVLGRTSASDLAARLVVFGFLLFALQLAFGIFGPNPVSSLLAAVIGWLPRLFVAVVIVVVAAAVAGWVRDLIAEGLRGVTYGRGVATTAQVLIITLGLMAALDQVGVARTVTLPILIAGLATVAGILIVGVGGGLIKPMQHRWERVLNRAETETTLATEKIRARRAATAGQRLINTHRGYDQPAYGNEPTTELRPPSAPSSAPSEADTAPIQ